MRMYVQEKHVMSANEVDTFIQTKEKNGFTITDVSYHVEDSGAVKKCVTIEKWNKQYA